MASFPNFRSSNTRAAFSFLRPRKETWAIVPALSENCMQKERSAIRGFTLSLFISCKVHISADFDPWSVQISNEARSSAISPKEKDQVIASDSRRFMEAIQNNS